MIKTILFLGIVIITSYVVSRNINEWSESFRVFNLKNIKNSFGDKFGFLKSGEKKWFLYFCKIWIIFVSLLFLTLVYLVLFGTIVL